MTIETNRRRILAGLGALAVSPLAGAQSATSDFPNRTIRIVVPYAAGGGGDASTRTIAEPLGARLGVSVIIENRPGANGYTGAQVVRSAQPDGYTLMLGFDGSLVVGPHFFKPPFDPLNDFAPITKLNDAALILAAHPSVKARNLAELIEVSKSRPGGLQFGSSGAGSTTHLAGELLGARTGLKLEHVPYKGGGQAVLDVVGGQIPLILTVIPTVAGFIRDGRLVPIAVSSDQRAPSLPEVQTLIESGVAGFDVRSWFGILAPAGTPRPIVERLQKEIAAVLAMPDVRDKYLKGGFVPVGNSPDAFAQQMRADSERWAKLVKEGNIKVE